MARKKRETLVLFPELVTITQKFSDAQFGALMRAVFSYRFSGELYTGEDAAVDVAFQTVKAQVDRYADFCKQQSDNAKGSQEQPNEAEYSQSEPSDTHTHTHTHSHSHGSYIGDCTSNENSTNNQPGTYNGDCCIGALNGPTTTRQRFTPPSADDVRAYATEKGYTIDPEAFVDYYTANGWKVGKNPMKDWRAAVRTWIRKEKENGRTSNSNRDNFIPENPPIKLNPKYVL